MHNELQSVMKRPSSGESSFTPGQTGILLRKCACGGTPGPDSECAGCRRKRLGLQRHATFQTEPLDMTAGDFTASRPGHDFGRMPVYAASIQQKLRVNTPGDVYEQEADRVADRVMRMPHAQPHWTGREHQPEHQLRRLEADGSGMTEAPPIVHEVLRSPGQPLDAATKAFFAPRFGHDFSHVRVHTDAAAAHSARAVDASAYTVGRDIVFASGKYEPGTDSGRRLLAHELTHVAQQDSHALLRGAVIQRDNGKPKPATIPAPGKARGNTAADAPKLDNKPSANGTPCACVVFVHNNERNARLTAELMHKHCAYNLAIIAPDATGREIRIPGKKGTVDPNELFSPDVAEECLNDEKACRDFLKTKSGTTDSAEIEEFVKKQFFLAIKDCSNSFSLPVVALHNNDIEDTKEYLGKKDKVGVDDLKMDVDKTQKKEGSDDPVKRLKDLLQKKFDEGVKKKLTEETGKTNIFRWCASNDLSKCHIGDPHHPDNVVWVTNEKDFETLSKKDVNVALQSDLSSAKGGESEGDLSTLFLVLKGLLGDRFGKSIVKLEQDIQVDVKDIETIIQELQKLAEFDDLTLSALLKGIGDVLQELLDILIKILLLVGSKGARDESLAKLRYINIETPGKTLAEQTDSERVQHYEFIVETLKALGLHCCGADPAKAEKSIKEGLKTTSRK
jgi:hypothetical protein